MKTFRFQLGHKAGQTMTVAELRELLAQHSDDMPVMVTWESVHAYVKPENFSVERVSKGFEDDACDCLVVDVNEN